VLPDARLSPLATLFPNVLLLDDSPLTVTGLFALASASSVALAVGCRDRVAALVIAYVWACLHGRMPLIANPSLPFVGFLLLLHACLPRAPFGSLDARGRDDPSGGWALPPELFAVLWIVMAAGYSYSGLTKLVSPSWLDGSALSHVLENPLARPTLLREALLALPPWLLQVASFGALAVEIGFAPLAIFARARPLAWLVMVSMHLGLLALIDFADLSSAMLVLHVLALDPAWIRSTLAASTERVFYDGDCGMCHSAVRFVLAEDRESGAFRFAALGGATFQTTVSAEQRDALPDSLVVQRDDGQLLVRSRAVLHLMHRLGGLWRVGALVVGVLPRRLADAAYDAIARVRKRLFRSPTGVCPVLAPELRARFDA
jgi:predicted DCC family thiol-disulfide oxidoreductase YuxK